ARKSFESEFRLSRVFRRAFFDEGGGLAIIDAARRSDAALALVSAVLGGMNEHDVSLPGLFRRWWRARSEVRRDPRAARREGRVPAPCPPGCGCDRPGAVGSEPDGERTAGASCAA
ncbi:MAG TPA: hypothetical protein VE173_13250, partial [Longimicrobiales bacterium]|nr:hypothetical protein [Longimicrobiales bacterium]